MKAFGLELRRTTGINARSLYADVDRVLQSAGVTADGVGSLMQQQTVAHALQAMMKPGKWFDICAVKKCADLCGICIPAERMRVYHPLHCIHWNEMLPEFRATVCAMLLDDFRTVLTPERMILESSEQPQESHEWVSDCCRWKMLEEYDRDIGLIGSICLKCNSWCTPVSLTPLP